MDAKILEARLLTRESALVTSSVSKCAAKLQSYLFSVAAASNLDKENEATAPHTGDASIASSIDATRESLIREISLYRFEMVQVLASASMCERELSEYVRMEEDIERDIQAAEKRIEQLTEELREHKSVRRHKEEVDMLARLVNTLPAGSVVDKEMRKAQEALDKLRAESAAAYNKVTMRSRQFQVLLQSLSDLQRSVEEEEEQQRAMALLAEEAGAAASGTAFGASGGAEEDEEATSSDVEERGEDRAGRARDLDLHRAQKKARLGEVDSQDDGTGDGLGAVDGEDGDDQGGNGEAEDAMLGSTEKVALSSLEEGEEGSPAASEGAMDVASGEDAGAAAAGDGDRNQ
jgi:THO complex subunit 7